MNTVKCHFYEMTATSKYHPYPRVSRRFESIYILAREQHDAHEPRRHHEWPQLVRMIRESTGSHLSLVHVFHVIPHARLSVGVPVHYPGIHHCRRGEGSSNSVTIEATKFVGPHKSRMCQYIIKLAHRGQMIDP
jgi:hypothetical protein